ncbi:MAG: outer membrane protein OmpA-like peptidoglycan-associated protein [Enterobacterales bacterium]|jgi:outer membrane protein OmpA-like peptidoglycan-associated protein
MNIKSTLLILTLCVSVSACQVLDPYTGESSTGKAATYGIGAALVCGLIGATKSGKRARNAAAGCGAIGASVGLYMDTQESELRKQLVNTGVQVKREGDRIRLIMPNNITFDTARSDLQSSFMEVLNSIILVLNQYPDTLLNIEGHTDSVGSDNANLTLSNQRANAVAQYLTSQGVANSRVSSRGAGEQYPVASNDTDAGRALNRRVELSISPLNTQP